MSLGFQEQLADSTWAPEPPANQFVDLPSVKAPAYLPSRPVRVLLDGCCLQDGQRVELRETRVPQWIPARFLSPSSSKAEPCLLIPRAHRHLSGGNDMLPMRHGDELRLPHQEAA